MTNKEFLLEAIGEIDDTLIDRASTPVRHTAPRRWIPVGVAACLVLVVVGSLSAYRITSRGGSSMSGSLSMSASEDEAMDASDGADGSDTAVILDPSQEYPETETPEAGSSTAGDTDSETEGDLTSELPDTESSSEETATEEISWAINQADGVVSSDLDVQITSWNPDVLTAEELENVINAFDSFTGAEYETLLEAFPDGWTVIQLQEVSAPMQQSGVYEPHDYILTLTNPEADQFSLAVSPLEAPLRDAGLVSEDPQLSRVGDVSLTIIQDASRYQADFKANGLYYSIAAEDVTWDQLEDILIRLLP